MAYIGLGILIGNNYRGAVYTTYVGHLDSP